MKGAANAVVKASKPRRSSSVIICREQANASSIPNNEGGFTYDMLMLRRLSTMAFGGMHSFPGGNMDAEDLAFSASRGAQSKSQSLLQQAWQDALIYTAARELFEETGLVFAKSTQKQALADIAAKSRLNSSGVTEASFKDIFEATQPDLRSTFVPFLRIVTIQSLPKRWDTQFFLAQVKSGQNLKADSMQLFNFGKLAQTRNVSDLEDTNSIILNPTESDACSWETPMSALSKFNKKEIKLAPPQILICNLMSSLKDEVGLEKYKQEFCNPAKVNSSVNLLKANPSTFPFMFDMRKGEKGMELRFCGDEQYPIEALLEKEEDPAFKEEIQTALRSVEVVKGQQCRISTDFVSQFEVKNSLPYPFPFGLIRNFSQNPSL